MRLHFTCNLSAVLLILVLSTPPNADAKKDSLDPVENEETTLQSVCNQSEFPEFMECIVKYNEKLKKRETITLRDLEACTVTRKNCISTCDATPSCDIEQCPYCPTVHLIKGEKKILVEGENDAYKYEMPILPGQNITTIIKLTNVINNTNIVDIPTNINSTNINNIHIYNNESSKTGGNFGLGYTKEGSCCFAVQPKTCAASSQGFRCHHRRHKTCGKQCTSRVIHVQSRQKCQMSGGCQQRIGYVPQPASPKCVYTHQWPYVSCGGHYQQSCDGCYDHYGYGYGPYHGGRVQRSCMGCYDDGFEMGPLYRRGPVLRPFNYHQPPCYLTGSCYPMCTAYGCYGNEFIDPVWGYTPYYMPARPMEPDYYDPTDADVIFTNEIEKSNNSSSGFEENSSQSWGVQMYKCKVLGDDGTTKLQNCTDSELSGNPFAGSPSNYPYYPVQPNESPDYDFAELNVPHGQIEPMNGAKRSYRNLIFGHPRNDYVYDDYVTDEQYQPRKRAIHKKKNHSKKRKMEIVYDE